MTRADGGLRRIAGESVLLPLADSVFICKINGSSVKSSPKYFEIKARYMTPQQCWIPKNWIGSIPVLYIVLEEEKTVKCPILVLQQKWNGRHRLDWCLAAAHIQQYIQNPQKPYCTHSPKSDLSVAISTVVHSAPETIQTPQVFQFQSSQESNATTK